VNGNGTEPNASDDMSYSYRGSSSCSSCFSASRQEVVDAGRLVEGGATTSAASPLGVVRAGRHWAAKKEKDMSCVEEHAVSDWARRGCVHWLT
jgi:hypothetical protein